MYNQAKAAKVGYPRKEMPSKKRIVTKVFFLFALFAVLNCHTLFAGTVPSAVPPADTRTCTYTLSPTGIPTLTPSFTSTPSFTPTSTPTFTETPPYNLPGSYSISKCATFPRPAGAPENIVSVTVCVVTVKVKDDRSMQFNMTWTVLQNGQSGCYILPTDVYNHHLYLEDDLKNEYQYTDAGGCASVPYEFCFMKTDCHGWFLFPPAQPGAKSFRFVDMDHLVYIDDIVLWKKE
jgi:hypothetical protein